MVHKWENSSLHEILKNSLRIITNPPVISIVGMIITIIPLEHQIILIRANEQYVIS